MLTLSNVLKEIREKPFVSAVLLSSITTLAALTNSKAIKVIAIGGSGLVAAALLSDFAKPDTNNSKDEVIVL